MVNMLIRGVIISIFIAFGSFSFAQPNTIANLVLWLNADSGIVLNGGNVSDWNDQSGNNNDLQAVAGSQPFYVAVDSSLNNHAIIQFDGSNDFFSGGDILDIGKKDRTLFLVGKSTNRPATYLAKALYGPGDKRYALWYNTTIHFSNYYIEVIDRSVTTTRSYGQYEIFTLELDRLSGTLSSYFSSSLVGINSLILDTAYDFNSTYRFLVGAFNDAADAGQTNYLNGEIAEIIIYDSLLTSAERNQVEQYLQVKYAPPVNIGPDTLTYGFCPFELNAYQDWYTSYLWNSGDTLDSVLVGPGVHSVTVANIFDYSSSDTMILTYPGNFNPFPDTLICLGDTLIWDTQLDTILYDFLWQNSSTDSSLTITQAGAYYVQVTDTSGCSLFSDTINVMMDTFQLIPYLGPDTTICQGAALGLQIGASLASSYLWSTSPTDTLPTITLGNSYI